MTSLKIYNVETAPEASKPLLQKSIKENGMLPGLHGVLAGSPSLLETYQNTHKLFTESSFNNEEITVVWQTINVEHECHYCVPAHTAIAGMMQVDESITEALRNKTELPNKKLQALHNFTLLIVRNRGHVTAEELNTFYEAGYNEQNVLEVILGLSQKIISNYTNHIANTPIDPPFEKFAWKPTSK